jgi:hypothetical protein
MGNEALSRLFTFGCSFTHWPWPTWADIIAYDLAIPHQNWGVSGLGNVGVHSRLIECDLRNTITEDDIILVVWSSWTREDRYNIKLQGPKWTGTGDVMFSYDEDFIKNYWSINNDLMKNSTAIISANKMFDIKFNGHITTPLSSLYNDSLLSFSENEKEISLFFEPHIPNDGEFQVTKYQPCRYTKANESHPDILSHLDYVNEFICPKLGRVLNEKTVDFFTEMHYNLLEYIDNVMDTTDGIDYRRKISPVFEKFNWQHTDLKGF